MKQKNMDRWFIFIIVFGVTWFGLMMCCQKCYSQTTVQAENWSAMAGVQTENCSEGGLNVGYINNTDNMDYNITAPVSGIYLFSFRVAANVAGSFQLKKGTTVLATLNVPATGGYQVWTTITAGVNLTAGSQTLRIVSTTDNYWNINWFSFTPPTIVTPPPIVIPPVILPATYYTKVQVDSIINSLLLLTFKVDTMIIPIPGSKSKYVITKPYQ